MATLRHRRTGKTLRLRPDHLVGRSPDCALRLDATVVSERHAEFRWSREGWRLRDLGSLNGTFLNDRRLAPGTDVPVREAFRIAFGEAHDAWTLTDADAPTLMAQPLEGGADVWVDGELLALPGDESPLLTVYPARDGIWVREQDGQIDEARDREVLRVAGRLWRLYLPRSMADTMRHASNQLDIADISLRFRIVGQDRNAVRFELLQGDRRVDLGVRPSHELLLALAEKRLEDRKDGVTEAEQGWMPIDVLTRMLTLDESLINVHVHRARRQLQDAHVADAAHIIERRRGSRAIRLGVARVEIV